MQTTTAALRVFWNYGRPTRHHMLERCTWHPALRAPHIQSILEKSCIAPDGPLTTKDYAGLPMPEGMWEQPRTTHP